MHIARTLHFHISGYVRTATIAIARCFVNLGSCVRIQSERAMVYSVQPMHCGVAAMVAVRT